MTIANELLKLQQLKEAGVINEEEFLAAKSSVLGSTATPTSTPAQEAPIANHPEIKRPHVSVSPAQKRGANASLVGLWDNVERRRERSETMPEALGAVLQAFRGKLYVPVSEPVSDRIMASLAAGADVDVRDANGSTALINAVFHYPVDCVEALQILLDAGADVNARTEDGYTVLMVAARVAHLDVIRLLVKAGADKHATNKGMSASRIAKESRHYSSEPVRAQAIALLG